jgi:hypothetical protein
MQNAGLFLATAYSFATWHGPAGAPVGASIGAGALPMRGQIAPMAQTTITLDLLQAFDVHLNLTPQVTFHTVIPLNHLAQADNFVFCQISYTRVWTHFRLSQNILAAPAANAIDIRQPDLNTLPSR